MNIIKKAICFIFDNKYINQGKHAILSAKKYNPDHTTVWLTDEPNTAKLADIQLRPQDIEISESHWLTIGRVAIVEYCLSVLKFDTAIFVDGDTYTYNTYEDIQKVTEQHSIVVIPHITKPLPDDNKYPQNRVISLSGNYNTGMWSASQSGLPFIKWWKEQTTLFPVTRPELGLVNEQGWLRFAGDFDDHTKIFRHPGYNVAYWNIKQREISLIDDEFIIDNHKLVLMHFSGLKQNISPVQMSVFQNRYFLSKDDLVYKLFNDYHNLVWN